MIFIHILYMCNICAKGGGECCLLVCVGPKGACTFSFQDLIRSVPL